MPDNVDSSEELLQSVYDAPVGLAVVLVVGILTMGKGRNRLTVAFASQHPHSSTLVLLAPAMMCTDGCAQLLHGI